MTFRRYSLGLLLVGVLAGFVAPSLLRAQSVEFLYDKGGVFGSDKYVTVAHSGEDGTIPPDTSAVWAADRVYFAFQAKGDWRFEGDDRETLRTIEVVQEGRTLPVETVSLIGGEGAETAVVGIRKSPIDWLSTVTVRHEADTSRALRLKEQYAPGYEPLQQAYRNGRRFLDQGAPLEAVKALPAFYGDVEPAFALVGRARALLDTASTQALDRTRSAFRTLRKELIAEADADGLARLDSFRAQLDSVREILTPYTDARPEQRADVKQRLDNLDRSADQLYTNARESYRRETLRIFMRETYENPKLRLYLDVLARMLIDVDAEFARTSPTVDSLRLSLLDAPDYADVRRRLESKGWAGEFREIVVLVNENIHERGEVFGDEIMESLRLRRPAAPQPYYEIAAAMNAILDGNRMRFAEAWDRALEKMTDLTLLEGVQRWRIASRLGSEALPSRARSLAQEARAAWREGNLGAAQDRFQLAVGVTDRYAPLYYDLGQVKLAQGDTSAARAQYQTARALESSYAPPEVMNLRILLKQERYDQALARSDSLLQQQPYWLFYMPKARALMGLERYDKARQVLRGRCEPLNDESYALYALMAEAYARMGTWDGVKWAMKEARALSPRRAVFARRMSAVRTQAREEGVSLVSTEGDSTTTTTQSTVSTDTTQSGRP